MPSSAAGELEYYVHAGAFALALNLTPGYQSYFIGFRCASDPVDLFHSFSSSAGREATGADQITVGSISDAAVTQSVNLGDTANYDLSAYVYNNTTGNVGVRLTQQSPVSSPMAPPSVPATPTSDPAGGN